MQTMADKPAKVLMKDGVWLVPPDERPKGWERFGLAEPTAGIDEPQQAAAVAVEPEAESIAEWDYLPGGRRHREWPFQAKLQYDLDRRVNRAFAWSHRQRTQAPSQAATKFREYADAWWRETRILSSIQAKVFNEHYQRIIGMGTPALPLIFADLKRRGGQWYWALECITGENPAHGAATLDEARERWLDYAVRNGYLSE